MKKIVKHIKIYNLLTKICKIAIKNLKINDDELFEILKETLCDAYALSKCEKIYRIANWFSGFLSFSCLYNQTNVSNKLRYYPEYPIVPL
jgi:hypothetical protein